MAIFKRCLRLSLQVENLIKTYEENSINPLSLKVEFETEAGYNSISNGNIILYGLNDKDAAFLSTNYKNGAYINSLVTLEAGYNDIYSLILNGNIIETIPDFSNPDYSVKFKVISGVENNNVLKYTTTSIKRNATLFDIAKETANNNNLALDLDSTLKNKNIGDYTFQGTPFYQIENLRNYFNKDVLIYVENKKLVIKNEAAKTQPILKLNNKNGLIGTPRPTNLGCEVITLLNANLRLNDFIELESLKIPQLNGTYRIINIKHRGSNRGEAWNSILLLQKG